MSNAVNYKVKDVPFDRLNLDPNNPRNAPERRPGYEDPKQIFDEAIQQELDKHVEDVYEVDELEDTILNQGWLPLDPIIVWEHHKKKGYFVVVEGNTRTEVLRRLRIRLVREKAKLKEMIAAKDYPKPEIDEQKELIAKIQKIVDDTDLISVFAVVAKSPAELEKQLPHIHGVRHIRHAKDWKPYPTNKYIQEYYRQRFNGKHGANADLRLDDDLIADIAGILSMRPNAVRASVQISSAFDHFQRHYKDRLEKDDKFRPEDQFFFEQIYQIKYAREQFGFGKDAMQLKPEMEETLFKWAFKHPRQDAKNSKNVIRMAKDFKLWHELSQYDNEQKTSFAMSLDVNAPDNAMSMNKLQADYLSHKAYSTPLTTFKALLETVNKLDRGTIKSQASHLRPLLEKLRDEAIDLLNWIEPEDKPKKK